MTTEPLRAIAVYCGSSIGKRQAYSNAALSVGRALALQDRPLVYGGGQQGLMGIVSNAVLQNGGEVIGIIPYAMYAAGGEREKSPNHQVTTAPGNSDPGKMKTIIVDSMHERKVKMANLSSGFIGLPGGFGTYEEVFEVTTWSQLKIHNKPVVLLNVLSFFDPLRQLVENGISEGYINPGNRNLIIFVDGPSQDEHETFDWGTAALDAIKQWKADNTEALFNWKLRKDGTSTGTLKST